MHHITRRLSPSLIVAIVALFVALAGTAAAAVIIKNPDELGDNVVTGRATAPSTLASSDILNESILNNDLDHPQLKVRVFSGSLGNTSVFDGSDGTVKRNSLGSYFVTFDASALNANGKTSNDTLLNNDCAFTATSRDKLAWLTVIGPLAGLPNTVRVDAITPDPAHPGDFKGIDTSFDIIASC
jgi:hypothetical protein